MQKQQQEKQQCPVNSATIELIEEDLSGIIGGSVDLPNYNETMVLAAASSQSQMPQMAELSEAILNCKPRLIANWKSQRGQLICRWIKAGRSVSQAT
ncbi:MAG: hypothetical protein AAGE59_12760 [Cyanobacteria bacterium P01_F01_bin.86]